MVQYRKPILAALGVATLVICVVVVRGCAVTPSRIDTGTDGNSSTAGNPWTTVLADIRRQPDQPGIRVTLDRLNSVLNSTNNADWQPSGLTAEREKQLAEQALLTKPELTELRSSSYTPLDSLYVAESYYLRDSVRGLDVGSEPPLNQVKLALAWIGRQVIDRPWIQIDPSTGRGQLMPPMPPMVVLTRGYGTGLERAIILLGLVQQMGLDGYLVGPPEASTRGWNYKRDTNPNVAPTGPHFAVGVRIGADVYLFDTWRNAPVPGAKPGEVATLQALKANPALVQPWRSDSANPHTVPESDIQSARLYPAVSLSALAPRMERLERELKGEAQPVRLSVDLQAMITQAEAAGTPKARVWNPEREAFTHTRVLASYWPTREGGYSPLADLPTQVQASLIPRDLIPPDSPVNAVETLKIAVYAQYVQAFLESPSPKERIARGLYSEVVPQLVARLKEFQAAQDRLRTYRGLDPEAIRQYVVAAREIEAKRRLARDREPEGKGPLSREAIAAEDALRKEKSAVIGAILDDTVGTTGAAEATYLLALALHEQAERAQSTLR